MFWFVVAVVVFAGAAMLKPTRNLIERKILFAGAGIVTPVPSTLDVLEAGVYRMRPRRAPVSGVVMFLHGNGADAPAFASMMHLLADAGWEVLAPEYPGYGALRAQPVSISATRERLVRIWNQKMRAVPEHVPRILLGFSLGGGFAYSIADQLERPPTKIVLVNTFAGLGEMGSSSTASFLSDELADWNIRQLASWCGALRVVYSPKDELFSPEHAAAMARHGTDRGLEVQTYALRDLAQVEQYHSQSPLVDRDWIRLL
jgi:dienelactone hydrolase